MNQRNGKLDEHGNHMSTRALGRPTGADFKFDKECRLENMTTETRSLKDVSRDGARKRKGPQPKFLEQRQLNEKWNRKAQKLFHKNAHFEPGWSRDSRAIVSIKCQVTPCSDSFTIDARCTSREPERDRYCVAQHEKHRSLLPDRSNMRKQRRSSVQP